MSTFNQTTANQLYNKYCDLGGKQTFKRWLDSELNIWKKSDNNFMDFTEFEKRRLDNKMVQMGKKIQTYNADTDVDLKGEDTTSQHKTPGLKKTYFLGMTAMELVLLGTALFAVGYTVYSNIKSKRASNVSPAPAMPQMPETPQI